MTRIGSTATAFIFCLSCAAAFADDVPHFNVAPSCRVAAENEQAVQICIRDEEEARTQLARQWTQFPAASRTNCTAETSSDNSPSYVELLTCLQINEEVAKLPKKGLDFQPYPRLQR